MRRQGKICAILALSAIVAACGTDDLGTQYTEIGEEESGLLFYGPGLAGGFRRFLVGRDEQHIKRTTATYGPRAGDLPHAQLYFVEMPPGRHFTRLSPVEEMIEGWGYFENKTIVQGSKGSAVNVLGRIDHLTFTADGIACVIWRQPLGIKHDRGVGTILLDGYYCKGEGPMMSAAEAKAILKLIGHRKLGPVKPPPEWYPETAGKVDIPNLPFFAAWGHSGRFKTTVPGRLIFNNLAGTAEKPTLQGDIQTDAGPHGACNGGFELVQIEDLLFEGEWSLNCTDGVAAEGRLTIGKQQGESVLTGSGTDSEKQPVTLSLDA